MKERFLLGCPALLVVAGLAFAAPVTPFADEKGYMEQVFEPLTTQLFSLPCKAKERTSVIVYGQGTSPMAVYVYDIHGNCVAMDDVSTGRISDDLMAAWYPEVQQIYDIEIRNLGLNRNRPEIAMR